MLSVVVQQFIGAASLTPRALPAAPLLGCTAGKASHPWWAAQINR
jgi:hypothetical protein